MIKLTNEEFDKLLLSRKLSFQLSEAARLVLVHGSSVEVAASLVGLAKAEITKVNDTLKLFEKAKG